jgi:hypothetical protein
MIKPCSTNDFLNALCEARYEEIDYDFYDIQDAVVHWWRGGYEDALKYIPAKYVAEILSCGWVITHDINGKVDNVEFMGCDT